MNNHAFANIIPIRFPMIETHLEQDCLDNLDPQAVTAVYNQYFPEIFRYVQYRLGDDALAEDISSEVFFHLLKAVKDECRPVKNLRGWLIGTARHMVVDHIRLKYRHPCDEISDAIEYEGDDPCEEVEKRDNAQTLQLALIQLTEDQQQVLALRFGQGFSLEETAALMNKKINAIKALQYRALNALQLRIGEEK